jgi:hypothetical protein
MVMAYRSARTQANRPTRSDVFRGGLFPARRRSRRQDGTRRAGRRHAGWSDSKYLSVKGEPGVLSPTSKVM